MFEIPFYKIELATRLHSITNRGGVCLWVYETHLQISIRSTATSKDLRFWFWVCYAHGIFRCRVPSLSFPREGEQFIYHNHNSIHQHTTYNNSWGMATWKKYWIEIELSDFRTLRSISKGGIVSYCFCNMFQEQDPELFSKNDLS